MPESPPTSTDLVRRLLEDTDTAPYNYAVSCPDPAELEQYLAGALEEPAALALEQHLGGCEACQRSLDTIAGGQVAPPVPVETAWGSSVAIAAFGPGDMPAKAFRRIADKLEELGAAFPDEDLEDDVFWVGMDTSAHSLTGDPIDATRLLAWVRLISGLVDPRGPVGAVVTASRGFVGPHGPFGNAIAEARRLAMAIVPGQVLVSQPVAEALRALGIDVRALTDSGLARVVIPRTEPSTVQSWTSVWGSRLVGLVKGAFERLEGLDLAVGVQRAQRSAEHGVGAGSASPLEKGDALRIRYRSPENSYLYVLLEQGGSWTASSGDTPTRSPGQPTDGDLLITLPGTATAGITPVCLASDAPFSGLDALLEQLKPGSLESTAALLELLGQLLHEHYPDQTFALLVSDGD